MICKACGTQFPPHHPLPELCPICMNDRQFIPPAGQEWLDTTPGIIKREQLDQPIFSFQIIPKFAIGNRAIFIKTKHGNILWDCIPLLDNDTIDFIKAAGGLQAIAFSHPHFYSRMNEWAATFDCPVYIHKKDEEWIQYKGPHIQLWEGAEMALWDGYKIINIGGHFPGSSILQEHENIIYLGDTFYIAPSMQHMAIMYSYPNQILLHRDNFAAIDERMKTIKFHTAYGAFDHQNLRNNAMEVFRYSMQRYRENYGL